MSRRPWTVLSTGVLIAPLLLSGCGGGPVADGSTEPVDLAQFNESSERFAVIGTLGEPSGSVAHEHRRCDIYRLYTSGLGAGGKAAVKAAEMLTSVATLGLAQIVWAPVRAGTRPKQHTMLMCYAANNRALYAAPVAVAATGAVTEAEQPPISLAPDGSASTATPIAAVQPVEPPVTAPAATPMATPAAGSIGLDNVSREAIDGPNQVRPGRVIVPDHASADDLNTLSATRSRQANSQALAAQNGETPAGPATGADAGA